MRTLFLFLNWLIRKWEWRWSKFTVRTISSRSIYFTSTINKCGLCSSANSSKITIIVTLCDESYITWCMIIKLLDIVIITIFLLCKNTTYMQSGAKFNNRWITTKDFGMRRDVNITASRDMPRKTILRAWLKSSRTTCSRKTQGKHTKSSKG